MNARYVIFEIATCRRFSAKFGYERYFSYLADAACKAGAIPCFFNIPRRGYISASDDLDLRICKFARENNFPCYSMYAEMSALNIAGRIDHYLRDRTHTTIDGAEFYADHVLKFIDEINSSDATADYRYVPEDDIWPTWLTLDKVSKIKEFELFSRKGFEIPVISVAEGETVEFALPDGIDVTTMVTIFGPRTGDFRIKAGEAESILRAYDRDCHYLRIACMKCPENKGTLSFTQLPGRPKIKLTKGIPDDGPRLGQIGGFLGMSGAQGHNDAHARTPLRAWRRVWRNVSPGTTARRSRNIGAAGDFAPGFFEKSGPNPSKDLIAPSPNG